MTSEPGRGSPFNAPSFDPANSPYVLDLVERAFAIWCAHADLVEDQDAPHGQAFFAGYIAGYEAGLDDERL